MPVLSRTNLACMGVGDGQVSVEGVVPASLVGVVGGGSRWLGDRLVYQARTSAGYVIEACDLRTNARQQLHAHGANRLEAGRTVWAAWLAGYGYFDALGRRNASWYPLAVDDVTDQVAVCLDYQAGAGLGILDPMGGLTQVYSGVLDRVDEGQASFRDGELAYRAGGALRVRHRDGTTTVSALPYVSGGRHSRGYGLGWHETHGLVLYRLGAATGIPISADAHDFNPDMLTLDSGLVAVVSSRTAGEAPGDLRRYLVNPITRTVTFGGQTTPRDLVDLTETPDEPPAEVPTFAPWPCRVTVFQDGKLGDRFPLPAGVRDVDADYVYADIDKDNIGKQAAEAKASGRALMAYRDPVELNASGYPVKHVPICDGIEVVPFVPVYPSSHEETIDAAVRWLTDRLPRVGLVLPYYRQIRTVNPPAYNWPLQTVLDRQRFGADLARRYGVHDVALFVWARGDGKDGIVSRAEFGASFARLRNAAGSAAPAPAPTPVPAPVPVPQKEFYPMSALTLQRSKFTEGSYAADRGGKVYKLSNGRHLSIDEATGEPRPGGLAAGGPSETFFLKGDRAVVQFDDVSYTFLVAD